MKIFTLGDADIDKPCFPPLEQAISDQMSVKPQDERKPFDFIDDESMTQSEERFIKRVGEQIELNIDRKETLLW